MLVTREKSTMTLRQLIIALVVIGLVATLPVAGFARTGQQAESGHENNNQRDTDSPQTGDQPAAQDPTPVREEYMFVEGSLPFIPKGNTIATKLPLPLRLTAANVGVVTEALFREQDAPVLGEALRNVSSLNLQSGFGVHDFFTMRGFDSLSSGLILTDGAPEPEVTFYQLYNVELVEVLKGPAGFLYGSNPLAGAVNLVRKQPLPFRSAVIGVSAGSYETLEGSADLNIASAGGKATFRLNSLWREANHYRDQKESSAFAVNPAFTWRPNDRDWLTLNLEYVKADFYPDSGLPLFNNSVPDVPLTRDYQSPLDDSQQDIVRLQADFEHRANDWLTLRNKVYYRDLDWLSNGTFFNGVFPGIEGGLLVDRSLVLLDDHQRTFGNQLEGIFEFSTGGVSHNLLTGFEITRFSDRYTLDVAALPPLYLFDPIEPPEQPLALIPGTSALGDSHTQIFAPYVIDQIWFSDAFQLLVGSRLDLIDFDERFSTTDRYDSKLSPMLGATYAFGSGVSLYANFSRSFAPPSNRVIGERKPEESRQLEVGIKHQIADGRLQTTVAVYDLERENIAIPDDIGFTLQAGNQRSRGFEIDLAVEPAPGLRGFVSYAYTDAELTRFTERVLVSFFPVAFGTVDRSGNVPAFAPRHLLNLWLSKRFTNGLGIGVGGYYADDQFIAEDNLFVIDDVLTLRGSISYSLSDLRLQLTVKNLSDRHYLTRGFGGSSVIPATPISAFLRLDYTL